MIKKILMIVGFGFMLNGCVNSSDSIHIEGKVSRVGNEPFSYLSIKEIDSKKSYKIVNNENYEEYQSHVIAVEAKILKKSESRLIPTEIEIISIK
ncbi:MAG: Unknown protein [uncultured Campylobacterales bacterium]|uniref:Uncharacterized protein n=1 Tax=uncultured Campylobacterales bacterium TaxID=352960 RepID=A0A6S6T416_9BACT|nr:MAG: Unknown protein [uncultured Campylobacterales bacterium]